MSVALAQIPTVRELYKAGVLKAVDAAKHAPTPAPLARVSL